VDLEAVANVYRAYRWVVAIGAAPIGALATLVSVTGAVQLSLADTRTTSPLDITWTVMLALMTDGMFFVAAFRAAQEARIGAQDEAVKWSWLAVPPLLMFLAILCLETLRISDGYSTRQLFELLGSWAHPVYSGIRAFLGGWSTIIFIRAFPGIPKRIVRSKAVGRYGRNGHQLLKQGATAKAEDLNDASVAKLPPPDARRKGKKQRGMSAEERARAVYEHAMSISQLAYKAGISRSTASQLRQKFERELADTTKLVA
jgi:hypothetical protein